MEADPLVFVVDDDPGARESIATLVGAKGLPCETFATLQQFLEAFDRSRSGCLVVDIRATGMTGPQLQARLREAGIRLPIIAIAGVGNTADAVAALRSGAVTFLEKPCDPHELWTGICEGLDRDRRQRHRRDRHDELLSRVARLTPEEREVMDLVVEGKSNKVAASILGLSVRTVELRRAAVFDKMGARNVAELVRLVLELRDFEQNDRAE
jgi:FixJ family two-component response regulator